ncbi:MAG: type II secretion system F family protein [Lachnospiraceae bacterium]|nr:type II secretion system F family protein [Lachnospiraceae bacterium]
MGRSSEHLQSVIRFREQKNSGPPDYDDYRLSTAETLFCLLQGVGILALFSYVFYRSAAVFVLLLPVLLPFLSYRRRFYIKKRKEELTLQFREMMHAVIAGLQAGYSIENAFVHAHEDMRLLYGGNALICAELLLINRELGNNRNLEDVLTGLAERAHIPDIRDFAEVFRIAKRSGGDLPGILKNTADLISEKIEVHREIATQISAKKMEQTIMDLVPFGIILYIDATTPGFFDSLYHNAAGMALMTALMAVYLAAYRMAEKILDIAY